MGQRTLQDCTNKQRMSLLESAVAGQPLAKKRKLCSVSKSAADLLLCSAQSCSSCGKDLSLAPFAQRLAHMRSCQSGVGPSSNSVSLQLQNSCGKATRHQSRCAGADVQKPATRLPQAWLRCRCTCIPSACPVCVGALWHTEVALTLSLPRAAEASLPRKATAEQLQPLRRLELCFSLQLLNLPQLLSPWCKGQ